MSNFSEYYRDLLVWEGVPHRELVDAWPTALVSKVESSIRTSISVGGIIGLQCPIRTGSTNQSIGNQVEEHVLPKLASNIADFHLTKCSGAGYPDQILAEIGSSLRLPLEVKATSDWNENDSNRRVLTSLSGKIRKQFTTPIHHLLLTLLYKIEGPFAVVAHVRLDFLEPSTTVRRLCKTT
jgi:hypothetical protein